MNTISANLSQPDGTAFTGPVIVSSLPNHYKYQGKEYQPDGFDTDNNNTLDTYLAWSDFDARFFDVQLGRWHVPDPANQHLSPYVGMGNNPANRIDPDGMNDGKITYHASLPEVEVFGEKMRYVYVYRGGTDANQEGSTFSWFPNNGGGTHSTYRKGGGGNGGAVNRYRYDNSVTGSYPRSNRTTPTRKTTPAEEAAKKKQNELQNIVDSKKDELNAINKIKKKAEEAQGQGVNYNDQYAGAVEKLAGKPYLLRANGPDAFDCSSTACYGIRTVANSKFGDYTAHDLFEKFSVPSNSKTRGSVIFYDYTSDGRIDHITTILNSSNMLHPSSGAGVLQIKPINYLDSYTNNRDGTIYYREFNWLIINKTP